jgi:hypothetical protein
MNNERPADHGLLLQIFDAPPARLEPATVRWSRTEQPRDVGYRGQILARPRGFGGLSGAVLTCVNVIPTFPQVNTHVCRGGGCVSS